jgi:2-methylcitrate dehydratase PrpD
MRLVGGDAAKLAELDHVAPAVPGGLAIKLYPCCYALQRPLAAAADLGPLDATRVRHIRLRTPACSLAPLIHHRARTGLEGKFSLEYGLAAALIDRCPGFDSFSDAAVARAEAARLAEAVETVATQTEDGADQNLLAGQLELEVTLEDGSPLRTELALPPGAPERPPTDAELRTKLELCAGREADAIAGLAWESAADYLRSALSA